MNILEYAVARKLAGGGSGGGSDTPSGNFKKKFMSFTRLKNTTGNAFDHVTTLCSAISGSGVVAYDEELLPTKTYDGIKTSINDAWYIYFIEDENDIFVYADVLGTGTAEWVSASMLLEGEFVGVLTDLNQLTPNTICAFCYYVEAEGE